MPTHVFLAILVVLGFVVAACAVMAVVGWVLVAMLRAREARLGPREGRDQSVVVANGLFALDDDGGLLNDPADSPARR